MVRGTGLFERAAWLPAALLALYSAWLVALELRTSQQHVRPYFSDVEGEVAFHGVNTTISASLLGGAALLMLFAALSRSGDRRPLLLSQGAMFGLLAFDDRFMLHERLGDRLGIADHFVMAVWAMLELALLAAFCRPAHLSRSMVGLFLAGGALFALMFAFDSLVPHDMVLRLSIEDLAKTWGSAMFFATAWAASAIHLHAAEAGFDRRRIESEIDALFDPVRRQRAGNDGIGLEPVERRRSAAR